MHCDFYTAFKRLCKVPTELINKKLFNTEYNVLRMTGKQPFVLGKLSIQLTHILLLKIM